MWLGKNVHFYKTCSFCYCITHRLERNGLLGWLAGLDTSPCFLCFSLHLPLYFSSLYPSLHFSSCCFNYCSYFSASSQRWAFILVLNLKPLFFIIELSVYVRLVKVLLLTRVLAFPLAMGNWRWLDAIAFLLIASKRTAFMS